MIFAVYGEGAVAERNVLKWFVRFKDGNFNHKNQERLSRPSSQMEIKLKRLSRVI